MAITRSQIARQLLAEGGAPNPRKPFRYGGNEGDVEAGLSTESMSDFSTDIGGTAPNSNFGDTGDLGSEQANVAANLSAMQTSGVGQGENFPGVLGVINRGLTNFRNRTNLARRTSFLDKVGYGNQFNPEFIQSPLGLQTLKNMGYTTIEDVIAAQRGESESKIVKPMIPRLPTDIEPEKSDMAEAEFVQRFTLPEEYRLADGGDVRQAYGLGSIVKKVTGAVKKVAKSPIGKAALVAGTGYYLGGGSMGPFAKFLPTMKYGNAAGTGFGFGNILPNVLSSVGATGLADKAFTMGTAGKIATGIGATALASGLFSSKEEEESISQRIADRTGIDVEQIRKEVQDAYASGNTASLRNKYPFLITESAAAAEGGRIGFAEGTQGDEIIEEKGLPRLRNMPEFKGDEVKPADMMMAGYGYNEAMSDTYDSYLDMKKKGLIPPTMDFDEFLQEVVPEMGKKQGIERTMVAEGGMMDLGGNEMDLRGGGFVPLGVAEKADDVPARLSKNEFVFTADAVRAAGGGSVDKGADLMYKTMKQLENKVA